MVRIGAGVLEKSKKNKSDRQIEDGQRVIRKDHFSFQLR
jgi:hypothetical protein